MTARRLHIISCILALVFSGEPAGAQSTANCSCSISLPRLYQRPQETTQLGLLKASATPACHTLLMEWQLAQWLESAKGDNLLLQLQRLDSAISRLNCKDYDRRNFLWLKAGILHAAGDYTGSLDASLKQLTLEENNQDPYRIAESSLLIAATFNRLKRSAQGKPYTYAAMALLPKINDPWDQSRILYSLSRRYLWYYQDSKVKAILDSASVFAARQLTISRSLHDSVLLQRGYNLMNGVAHERGQFQLALNYIDSSLVYLAATDYAMKGTTYGDKADVLMELKRYPEAKRFADSCLQAHIQSGNPETIANAYALLYQIGERTGNYKDALDALNAYYEIQDSLTNVAKTEIVTELEKKYNQAKNEKTIKELAQEKQIYALLALAILLLLIAVAFYFRQKALRQKQLIMEAEQRLNRSRMNPHFFFNALSSLQAFALQDTDRKELASGLSRFSHIMRETLESTYKEYVTIEQETAFLQEYLELQQLRHPGKFSFTIEIDPDLDPELLLLPSMILQPFVENSVEHGFEGISYPGQISIVFSSKDKQLLIRITDNGKGLAPAVTAEPGHVSRAQQIVKDRIYLLRMKLKCNAGFSIRNRQQGNGVEVEILLPELDKSQINHP